MLNTILRKKMFFFSVENESKKFPSWIDKENHTYGTITTTKQGKKTTEKKTIGLCEHTRAFRLNELNDNDDDDDNFEKTRNTYIFFIPSPPF